MVSQLDAPWCTKNNDWCKKRQCQDRMSEIADMLIDTLTPRCKECGAQLSPYPFYTEEYELSKNAKEYLHLYRRRMNFANQ